MAHGERAAANSNGRREYMIERMGNRGGGCRGRTRGVSKKTRTHRVERARAHEELRRDAKSGYERRLGRA